MKAERTVLHAIAWRDLCPWLILFRAWSIAISPGVLALASLAVLLTPVGWRCSEAVFIGAATREDPALAQFIAQQRVWPGGERRSGGERPLLVDPAAWSSENWSLSLSRLTGPFRLLLSHRSLRFSEWLYLTSGVLWSLLVWGLAGATIARVALVRFGLDERVDIVRAGGLALSRLKSLLLAPLFPFGAIALLTLPGVVVGWLLQLDAGVVVAGILWVFVLALGFVSALLVAGLAVGWPLMPVAIVAEENGDHLEAFHRAYSYVYSRPFHFLAYVLLALLIGGLGGLLVDVLAQLTLHMTAWSVSWGVGPDRWSTIASLPPAAGGSATLRVGQTLIGAVDRIVPLIATGFRYSFLFCAAAAVYLLLRQQVDEAEFDELYRDDDEPEREARELERQLGLGAGPPPGPHDDIG